MLSRQQDANRSTVTRELNSSGRQFLYSALQIRLNFWNVTFIFCLTSFFWTVLNDRRTRNLEITIFSSLRFSISYWIFCNNFVSWKAAEFRWKNTASKASFLPVSCEKSTKNGLICSVEKLIEKPDLRLKLRNLF